MAATYKLALDDFQEEDFKLFAIHTTLEMYRLAYFLNRNLLLHLKYKQNIDSFELFDYKNEQQQETWSLVSNTGERCIEKSHGDTLIFDSEPNRIKTYLIPEYKNVDYFLKIENSNDHKNINKKISAISQVITSFEIDTNQLKSKNNLIFY